MTNQYTMTLEQVLTMPVGISFNFLNGTAEQKRLYTEAAELARDTFNWRPFREAFLRATYKGKPGFASTSLTPVQALEKIIKAAETLDPVVDYVWEWNVSFYRESNNVVGYTNPSTKTIYVNLKFFDQYTPESRARNIFHELTHKLGFDHDFNSTAARPESLPYEGGDLLQEYAKSYRKGIKPPVVVVVPTEPTPEAPKPKPTVFKAKKVWYKPWTWF